MAELVIADAPYKVYPGGVIAVRAADWIAAGSSATSEVNALASTGIVVRETQQVVPTTAPFLDDDAYGEAEDTLLIPLSDIGTESTATYDIYITLLVEGEWDVTNTPLLRQCTNLLFIDVVGYGLHGDLFATETEPNWDNDVLCRIPHFQVVRLRAFDTELTDTLHFRFYSQDGTTAEVLIDQLVFVPLAVNDWTFDIDLNTVGISTVANITDGADGGDDNGKFTVYRPTNAAEAMRASTGSSDFQRVADGDDAEYHQRITVADGNIVQNSLTAAEASAHGYGLYAARYRGPIVYSEDTFDNRSTSTTGQDMGVDEAGYGYAIGSSVSANSPFCYVSGGVGVMTMRQANSTIGPRWGDQSQGSGGTQNQGAELNAFDQLTFSGFIEHVTGTDASASGGTLRFLCGQFLFIGWEIVLNLKTHTWQLAHFDGSTRTIIGTAGPHDISSWWPANELGFKIEVKRYVLRVKVWDASGAEPGTWDEEIFKPARQDTAPPTAYDYSGSLAKAAQGYAIHNVFGLQMNAPNVGMTFPFTIQLNSLRFEHDPYGDAADTYARMERPDGTSLGDIAIPWGCPHFVYWGKHDWTEPDGGFFKTEFSERRWNDTAAAEIQRAETLFWWFRVSRGGIVSMNWSSAESADITRVHA